MVTDAPLLTNPDAPPAFHLLAKPTGAICNLDCEYCFFLSKEMLYPGSRFRMADDLLETYIRQLVEAQVDLRVISGDDPATVAAIASVAPAVTSTSVSGSTSRS